MSWARLASFIAKRPALVDRIIERSQRTPYFHIAGEDGVYMRRWWLMPRWTLQADERGHLMPKAWMPVSIRIHHICRPDHDRDLHDHPFNYRTIILRGGYTEEDVFGRYHVREPGDTAAATAQTFHRIAEVSTGGVWTLFIMGKRVNPWGFLVGGRKVHWRTYLGITD